MSNARIRELSKEYIARGDLTGWHEQIYAEAQGDTSGISWADLIPNPNLTVWTDTRADKLHGKRTLVVGCGLGDDAEYLAELGMTVTAFDISPTAIEWCQRRFPASKVTYVAHDVTQSRKEWAGGFDWVLEIYTLQVLPDEIRPRAINTVAGYVADGGHLVIICRGRDESAAPSAGVPWPLTYAELNAFTELNLREESFDDFMDGDVRRFRIVYVRA